MQHDIQQFVQSLKQGKVYALNRFVPDNHNSVSQFLSQELQHPPSKLLCKDITKADLTQSLADVLGVSTMALNVPDIDTDLGFMHTLFALEDIYGLKIDKLDDEICIRLDKNRGTSYISLLERFTAWQKEAEKYRNGEISKEEYDHWRYTYPEVEVQRTKDTLDRMRKTN